jgi:putative membrane protein
MKATKTWLAIYLVFVLALCGLTACSRDRGVEAAREDMPPSVTPAEQDFAIKTAQAQLAEIDMARLALHRSSNKDVKAFANMIESDHTSALKALADLMKNKNVPQPTTLPADVQQTIMRMNALTGAEFDREFINTMVGDHQRIVGMFGDMQTTAQNPDVKDYVEDLLPVLEMHLDKAQQLQSKLFSPSPTSR